MEPAPLDLNRPRDLGALLNTTFALYGRHFPLFGAIALLVMVPVDLVFYGGLMGWLTGYDSTPPIGSQLSATYGSLLIGVPLITAMHVSAVVDIGAGRQPTIKSTMAKGFDVFGPLLAVLVLTWVILVLGFVALIIPGIYLAIALLVAPQAVVVEGRRGMSAISRSRELVKGNWWRIFGIWLVISILSGIATSFLFFPGQLIAKSTDIGPIALAGRTIADAIGYSVQALTSTLIFFDLKARKENPGWMPPPPPAAPPPPVVGPQGPEAPVPRNQP